MKRNILIGILVALGIALTLISPLLVGLPTLLVWIYLVREVWKQRKNELKDQGEKWLSENQMKRLQVLLIVAGASLSGFIVGSIIHNVVSGLYETDEPISLIFTITALVFFVAATAAGLVIFIRGQNKRV